MPPIQPMDILSLQAFLVALAQLDTGLPSELHQKIQEMGDRITQNPREAIAQIPDIVRRHTRLCELYSGSRRDLERRYQTNGEGLNEALVEGARESDNQWRGAVAKTLTARDPIVAARSMVKRFVTQREPERSPTDITPLLVPLYRAAHQIEAQEAEVLQALEYHPSTAEDLAFAVGLSLEQVQSVMASLWERGEVDITPGQVLHRVLPFLKPRRSLPSMDEDTYFTLTMRGHFRLHPLVRRPVKGAVR